METTKDSLLYAIEVSKSMLASGTFARCLEAVSDSVRDRMARYPTDNTGVLLYGIDGHKHNCRTLLELKPQDSHAVKLLMRLQEDQAFFEEEIVPAPPGSTALGDVFFQAGVLFEQVKTKTYRRLVLITNNDEPHLPKSRLAEVAKIKSYDLVQKNVTIVPVFVKPEGASFDVAKLWEEFYFTPDFYVDSSQVKLEPVDGNPAEIIAAITDQDVPRRPLFRNQIQLGQLTIDVRGYILYKISTVGQTFSVAYPQGKPQIATPNTHYVVEESGREVEKSELSRAFDFGKTKISVDKETFDELRNFGAPSIRILGFQDRSDIVSVGHLSHSLFLYPWDVFRKGSVRAFIALWNSLLKKGKMAIVSCTLRANSTPCLGALYPAEEASANGRQTSPPGLYLVILPYMDDIRDMPQNTLQKTAPDPLVDAMGQVVEQLTMAQGYNPERYRNPKLLWHSSVIEAQALSREMPQAAIDGTLPKYKSIETRAGAVIATAIDALDSLCETEEKPTKRQKTK